MELKRPRRRLATRTDEPRLEERSPDIQPTSIRRPSITRSIARAKNRPNTVGGAAGTSTISLPRIFLTVDVFIRNFLGI
jgi:hypothetical protein